MLSLLQIPLRNAHVQLFSPVVKRYVPFQQCCGSMTFWRGSGSGCGSMPLINGSVSFYLHHWPSRCQQKTKFFKKFSCVLLFEGTFTSFFGDKKVKKKSQNSRNQGFSYYVCLMKEGSGSGSRRPKNMWIRWIRIRIRIRNTAFQPLFKNIGEK